VAGSSAANTSDRVRRRRIILFVGLWIGMFAWSNIPPYRGNILEHERGFLVWHWQLYTTAGHGICDVRYFDMNQDGEPIERWTLLGYERPGLMPDTLARTEKKTLYTHVNGVCRALRQQGDQAPNVEVSARCAEKTTWKPVEQRERNVCDPRTKPKPSKTSQQTTKSGEGEQ
jgi:hypothetical protein